MKTKLSFLFLVSFVFYLGEAQIPQGFNYQAVARDGTGAVLQNTSLQAMMYVQSESTGGTIFWKELHSTITTNDFGLFTLVIGTGTRQIESTVATFDLIDWSVSPKYLKTEIYYSSSWKVMGTSQLMSVPYAMTSGDLTGTVDKLAVMGTTTALDEALFEVKNKNGQTIFAVYNEGVRIYVDDGAKRPKGGFAVGGFDMTKATKREYFVVSDDSVRIYLDSNPLTKGLKSGFAVGGYDMTKGTVQNYLDVNADSTRIYVDNNPVKGLKGGFAVGGFDATKGTATPFTSLTPKNYFIGHEGGVKITSGQYNSVVGYQSGKFITTGESNAFLGYQSGFNNNAGTGNLFLGYQTGYTTTGGSYNSFVGYKSGYSNTTGLNNSFLGSFAGYSNTTGRYNTFVGDSAGCKNLTGNENSFYGDKAGFKNLDGVNNIFIGNQAGYNNTDGDSSIFIGNRSGFSNTKGNTNVFMGNRAGFTNTIGFSNVFIGYQAGYLNVDGDYNTIMGYQAGFSNDSSYNSFIGYKSGYSNQTGKFNTFIGYKSGYLNVAGDYNSYIGYNTGAQNTGIHNVYIGPTAGSIGTTGSYNVFVGMGTGSLATGSSNSFIGIGSGYHTKGNDNSFFGSQSGITNRNGSQNVFIGHRAGNENYDASDNVFIGTFAGYSNESGAQNVYLGTNAGYSNAIGNKNIFIGDHAGENAYVSGKLIIDNSNTVTPLIYGDFDANNITINGTFNTTGNASINKTWIADESIEINASGSGDRTAFIDFHADNTNADFGFRIHRWPGVNGQANIYQVGTGGLGIITMNAAPINFYTSNTHRMTITPSGFVGIGTAAPGAYNLYVNGTTFSTGGWSSSDSRWKKDIEPLGNILQEIVQMNGVKFSWRREEFPEINFESGTQIGLIAQDVEKILPQLVKTNEDGYKAVAYDKLTVVLLEGMKEQQRQIESQQKQIDQLSKLIIEMREGVK